MIYLYIIIILILLLLFSKYISNINKNIQQFNDELSNLKQNYISYTDMTDLKEKYKYLRLKIVIATNKKVSYFLNTYDNINSLVDAFNKEYIKSELEKNRTYFDEIFTYPLDNEQRTAIITDDDNNLIIAGAGSGKTTTIIGKTRYLIDKKNIDPREIITISFTNAARDNFDEKLNNDNVRCSTFHKLGKDIIDDGKFKVSIAPENYLYTVIEEYLNKIIINNSEKSAHLIQLYAYYMHNQNNQDKDFGDVIELEKGYDLETLKYKYNKIHELKTLKEEKVKSFQELIIANYLFLHGINYRYEQQYKYNTKSYTHRQYHPDFYLPDYDIYIEHFGINKEGRAPQYNEIEEKRYLDGIRYKRGIHKLYKTKLIETYSFDFDDYNIEKILETKLKSNGVEFHDLNYHEIVDTIAKINNEEMTSFYNLISKFIKMFKGNNYELTKFDEFYKDSSKKKNIREMYLIEIIKDIYIYYQNKLTSEEYIDFDDMINLATQRVINRFDKKISYIIIDEFQDISYSRYKLVKAIQDKTHAKIVAVGDDWQSIYRFSGCDLNLFVNFDHYFPHPKIMYINNTYRNCQSLIDIAGTFIMQNDKGQIKKKLISWKEDIEFPIEYYYYKKNILSATEYAIKKLKKYGCKKIAILGRNNSDIEKYGYAKVSNKKEIDMSEKFNCNVVFTTVHKAKGIEYDGVIICNMDNYIAGFPNKMSDDPILDYVSLTKDDYLYEEERRLLYVALTRTKTKCLILVPIANPSIFASELYKLANGKIVKKIIEDDERLHNPSCPKCNVGILVTRQNDSNNSNFVGCSNYPKCDFVYNTTDILKNTIKCPKCGSYMVKRNSNHGQFYGCINYPYCNQTIENVSNMYYVNHKSITKDAIIENRKNGNKDEIKVRMFVDIKFEKSDRIYSYLCDKNFTYKSGDYITINSNGVYEKVLVIKGPYTDVKNDYSYKYIQVVK